MRQPPRLPHRGGDSFASANTVKLWKVCLECFLIIVNMPSFISPLNRTLFIDIVVCQSLVRRNLVLAQLRHEKRTKSATIIQSKWRARAAMDEYTLTLVDIVLVQSLVRRLKAQRLVAGMKRRVECEAVTAISSSWRRFVCLRDYQCTLSGELILCYFYLITPMYF
jgi:hypothetical protein